MFGAGGPAVDSADPVRISRRPKGLLPLMRARVLVTLASAITCGVLVGLAPGLSAQARRPAAKAPAAPKAAAAPKPNPVVSLVGLQVAAKSLGKARFGDTIAFGGQAGVSLALAVKVAPGTVLLDIDDDDCDGGHVDRRQADRPEHRTGLGFVPELHRGPVGGHHHGAVACRPGGGCAAGVDCRDRCRDDGGRDRAPCRPRRSPSPRARRSSWARWPPRSPSSRPPTRAPRSQ